MRSPSPAVFVLICLVSPVAANAQISSANQDSGSALAVVSPDASVPIPGPSHIVAPPAPQSAQLTLGDRFKLQARVSFGPSAFILPAVEAGYTMAHPPNHFPPDWSDGGPGFGRNYGGLFARHTTSGLTHFATAAALHEDPRYTACECTNAFARVLHALAYTVVDRSGSGRNTFAASNFAGAFAGGFVGMAYEPNGFNDVTHAYQRSALEFTRYIVGNQLAEFSPQLFRLLHGMHLPRKAVAAVTAPAPQTPDSPSQTPNSDQPAPTKP